MENNQNGVGNISVFCNLLFADHYYKDHRSECTLSRYTMQLILNKKRYLTNYRSTIIIDDV